MSVDLSSYKSIGTSLFIKWDIPNYDVLYFSTHHKPFTIDGKVYNDIGSLLNVSNSPSELRASRSEVSISISGIPSANVLAIMNANVKGSTVNIHRGYFDPLTWELLTLSDNPSVKFQGVVNNFSLEETWDKQNNVSSFTITLICSSAVGVLMRKMGGRRTNPLDETKFYPSDNSMNRVPNIKNSNFNFGAPTESIRIGTK